MKESTNREEEANKMFGKTYNELSDEQKKKVDDENMASHWLGERFKETGTSNEEDEWMRKMFKKGATPEEIAGTFKVQYGRDLPVSQVRYTVLGPGGFAKGSESFNVGDSVKSWSWYGPAGKVKQVLENGRYIIAWEDGDKEEVESNLHKESFESELAMGIEVEKEHTDDPEVAKKIAKDHLAEMPDYYTKLKKMENARKESFREDYIGFHIGGRVITPDFGPGRIVKFPTIKPQGKQTANVALDSGGNGIFWLHRLKKESLQEANPVSDYDDKELNDKAVDSFGKSFQQLDDSQRKQVVDSFEESFKEATFNKQKDYDDIAKKMFGKLFDELSDKEKDEVNTEYGLDTEDYKNKESVVFTNAGSQDMWVVK